MATSVRLSLLGGFELEIDGSTIGPEDFERRSGAELVQLLALSSGRRLHREQVMDALWPGAEMRSAANSLRKAATFVRRATGLAEAIVVRDQVVALFPGVDVEVDVDLVEAARADDEDTITAAIEAYRGEVLPDLPYAEWVLGPRDRLRRHLIAQLAGARWWDELLRLDPANEAVVVAVMDRALVAGDRQAVLRHYDELELHLRHELGVTPSPAAVALRARAVAPEGSAGDGLAGMRTFMMTEAEVPPPLRGPSLLPRPSPKNSKTA